MRDLSGWVRSAGHEQGPPRGGAAGLVDSGGAQSAESAESEDSGEAGETGDAADPGEAGLFGERGLFGEAGVLGETGDLALTVVAAETGVLGETVETFALAAEAGVTVVVAEVFCVAVGEAAALAAGDAVGVVPSSWTESHSGPSDPAEAKGPTPTAALPPMPMTPSDPITSHVVRLSIFMASDHRPSMRRQGESDESSLIHPRAAARGRG